MTFIIFDIIFLIAFLIFTIIFIYKNRKKVEREGILFIYRTKIGLKLIDKLSKKNQKLLAFISYLSIFSGYLFMFLSLSFLLFSLKLMSISKVISKSPPLIPILPYIDKIAGIKFLPPLYFTYWIIIILIVAVFHEFAHGIFARFYGIKIKSTGFGFLGPFIAAFVEPDEKKMKKKKIKKQLAILSAGSFANFLVGVLFILILQIFLHAFYTPIGISGYHLSITQINISSISKIGNFSFNEFLNLKNISSNASYKITTTENKTYFLDASLWKKQKNLIKGNKTNKIVVYLDSPAYLANLTGAIISVDGKNVSSIEDIINILKRKKPGDNITIVTDSGTYNIMLSNHPINHSRGFLGISYMKPTLFTKLLSFYYYNFNPFLKIVPKYYPALIVFFYDLFYWLILICISVALFNMLPFSFLDGGRVSYLTFLLIFKKKSISNKLYVLFNLFVLLIILLMLFFWIFSFI